MLAVIACIFTALYTYASVDDCKAYNEGEDIIHRDTALVRWINIAIFTVILVVIGYMMMRKLRLRYYSLYTDHGRKLWIIYIIQAISLLILTVNSILNYYSIWWRTYWWKSESVLSNIWLVVLNIVTWVIPMIA